MSVLMEPHASDVPMLRLPVSTGASSTRSISEALGTTVYSTVVLWRGG